MNVKCGCSSSVSDRLILAASCQARRYYTSSLDFNRGKQVQRLVSDSLTYFQQCYTNHMSREEEWNRKFDCNNPMIAGDIVLNNPAVLRRQFFLL